MENCLCGCAHEHVYPAFCSSTNTKRFTGCSQTPSAHKGSIECTRNQCNMVCLLRLWVVGVLVISIVTVVIYVAVVTVVVVVVGVGVFVVGVVVGVVGCALWSTMSATQHNILI
jgi:hypothetical protein